MEGRESGSILMDMNEMCVPSQVRCMLAGPMGGLDISMYSGGIICGDLVARKAMVLDISRKRVGFRV